MNQLNMGLKSTIMDKKINLDEIFEKQNPQDGKLPEWAKNFALESIRQVLELAAENVITT